MKQHLLHHYKGRPLMIVGRDRNWAALLIGRSFTLGRWHFYEFFFKTNPKADPAKLIRRGTHGHETAHTGQVEEAKGQGFLKLLTFLFSYFPKALLRRLMFAIKKPQWAPRDIYEVNAETDGKKIAAGTHPDWETPAETWAHFA